VSANIEERIGGNSYKEARETIYWQKLLQATDYLTETETKF